MRPSSSCCPFERTAWKKVAILLRRESRRDRMSLFRNTSYVASAQHLRDLPPPSEPEIAFAGRSNAGKSSAINALANQTRLAFVSKTPGRTREINFFRLRSGVLLVDL